MSEILSVGIFPCTVVRPSESAGRWKWTKRRRQRTENTSEIELNLETDVDVGTVDRWRPPQRETTVGDLTQSGTLSVRELLVLHRLLEP